MHIYSNGHGLKHYPPVLHHRTTRPLQTAVTLKTLPSICRRCWCDCLVVGWLASVVAFRVRGSCWSTRSQPSSTYWFLSGAWISPDHESMTVLATWCTTWDPITLGWSWWTPAIMIDTALSIVNQYSLQRKPIIINIINKHHQQTWLNKHS